AVREGQLRVGDDLLEVHADDPSESLADWAGAERRVEGEEGRGRIAEVGAAPGAVKAAAERPAAAFEDRDEGPGHREGGVGRRGDLGARLLPDGEAPDDDREAALRIEQAVHVLADLDGFPLRRERAEKPGALPLLDPRLVFGSGAARAPQALPPPGQRRDEDDAGAGLGNEDLLDGPLDPARHRRDVAGRAVHGAAV